MYYQISDKRRNRIKSKFLSLPIISMMLVLTGCETIINGTTQSIGISSKPSCTNVWVDNEFVGNTPLCVDLRRNRNHCIRVELEGYLPYEITCKKRLSGWVFGNLVFGGLPGLCIDTISGGIYFLSPEQVNACLKEETIQISKDAQGSYIGIVMQADPSWHKVGRFNQFSVLPQHVSTVEQIPHDEI